MVGSRNLRQFRWWGAPVTLTAPHETSGPGSNPGTGSIRSGGQASRFVKRVPVESAVYYTNTKNGYGGRDRLEGALTFSGFLTKPLPDGRGSVTAALIPQGLLSRERKRAGAFPKTFKHPRLD